MNKVLIVSNLLRIGGAEKLIFELVCFSRANNIEPVILILDCYDTEHYDNIYKKMNVKVVRARIQNIRNLKAPLKILLSIFWICKLKFFADRCYKSVHVVGLYNVNKIFHNLNHRHRFFWNVNNAIQFADYTYPYATEYFSNENDTIICINKYQIVELQNQYKPENIKSKLELFKLFIRENDSD